MIFNVPQVISFRSFIYSNKIFSALFSSSMSFFNDPKIIQAKMHSKMRVFSEKTTINTLKLVKRNEMRTRTDEKCFSFHNHRPPPFEVEVPTKSQPSRAFTSNFFLCVFVCVSCFIVQAIFRRAVECDFKLI